MIREGWSSGWVQTSVPLCTCEIPLGSTARYTWLASTDIKILIKYSGRMFHVSWVQWEFCRFTSFTRWGTPSLTVSSLTFLSSVLCSRHQQTFAEWTNGWIYKWMNVAWRTNPGVVIIACFLIISILDFTALSQETASLSSLENYGRAELMKMYSKSGGGGAGGRARTGTQNSLCL